MFDVVMWVGILILALAGFAFQVADEGMANPVGFIGLLFVAVALIGLLRGVRHHRASK
jgi:hypothetical protein